MNKIPGTKALWGWLLIAFLVLLGAFVLGRIRALSVLPIEVRFADRTRTIAGGYVPSYDLVRGSEIVMVYVGSSTCGFANGPEMPELIERTKLSLQQKAVARGSVFSVVGVSIDWNVNKGIQHLAKFGLFDEIMTGRKWQGHGGRHYFWESLPSSIRATPQVLVAARAVGAPNPEQPAQGCHVSNETVLVRKIGATPIANWLERGTPLPQDLIPQ